MSWARWERRIAPYVFTGPFFIYYAVFGVFPVLYAFYLSFHKQVGIVSPRVFVGLQNYIDVLTDERFRQALFNTSYYAAGSLFVILPLALGLGLLLHSERVRGKKFFRLVYFFPLLTSAVVVSVMFTLVFDYQYGLLNNYILKPLGLEPVRWTESAEFAVPSLIILGTWQYVGINALYFVAGLQQIPKELEDAARIDGATSWQVLRYVTLPLLRPVALFIVIQAIIGSYNLFAQPFLLGVGDRGMTVMVYLYQNAFAFLRFGFAAAIGYILFVIILVLSLIQLRLFGIFRED